MAHFDIDKEGDIYMVLFFEGSGMSILSKSKSYSVAQRRMKKFQDDYKRGVGLKEDASVWKY